MMLRIVASRASVRQAPALSRGAISALPAEARCRGQQTRCSSNDAQKSYKEQKKIYDEDMKAVRKHWFQVMEKKRAAELARRLAEEARIKESKRKRLLKKREEQLRTKARVDAAYQIYLEERKAYLDKMQELRDAKDATYKGKQQRMVEALTNESMHWVDMNAMDKTINERLFTLAGKSSASPTRHSAYWRYMAIPHLPDFSEYAEDELFDEREDMHFLTEKSPYKQQLSIPEGHELYEAGPVEIGFGNEEDEEGEEGEEGEEEEGEEEGEEAGDGYIYLEDGIYRPSYIQDIYDGSYDEFKPKEMRVDELEELKGMAERYEEELFELMQVAEAAEADKGEYDDDDEDEYDRPERRAKQGKDKPQFDPDAFTDKE